MLLGFGGWDSGFGDFASLLPPWREPRVLAFETRVPRPAVARVLEAHRIAFVALGALHFRPCPVRPPLRQRRAESADSRGGRHLPAQAAQSSRHQIQGDRFQQQGVAAGFQRRWRALRLSCQRKNTDGCKVPGGAADDRMVELGKVPVDGDHSGAPAFNQANGLGRRSRGEARIRRRRETLYILRRDGDDERRARIRWRRVCAQIRRKRGERFGVSARWQHSGSLMPPPRLLAHRGEPLVMENKTRTEPFHTSRNQPCSKA
jgi:hypothetical protein